MLGMTADSGPSPKQQYVVETAHTCSAVTRGCTVTHRRAAMPNMF